MGIGELFGLIAGIIIPLGGLIIGGFWKMNDRISSIKGCIGKLDTQLGDFKVQCDDKHKNIDRRLERIDNWREKGE